MVTQNRKKRNNRRRRRGGAACCCGSRCRMNPDGRKEGRKQQ